MRRRRPVVVGVPLALVPLLLAGCSEKPRSPEPEPKPTATATATATGNARETEQGERVRRALDLDGDEEFVESGLERVADGAHVRAVLERGEPYELTVACAGTGAVKVAVGELAPLGVACDGTPLRHRVGSAPAELPVEITPAAGASGMVGWRIDTVLAGDGTTAAPSPDDDDSGQVTGKPGRKVRR
ncbi:hypothetical protein [Streptomyces sp. NRRL F-5727]|uniref:hypothetical protein n=1 Tax=Streptomyces sp. NRRL F-5727 TaxID=1463871 RepID=UPI00131C8465|nr:hypothetical protein [Streptomyces sp. NRRL F-5727]